MIVHADPPQYTVHRWTRPRGVYPRWLIVHDPGNDRASPEQVWRFLRQNAAQSCYHQLLWLGPDEVPTVAVLAPWVQWVGHAGVATRIPRTTVVNRAVNEWTISISVCTYGRPRQPGEELFEAAADLCAKAIRECHLPDAGVVLAHREINTVKGRRVDPRGIDMEQLRAAIAARLQRGVMPEEV